MSREVEAKLDGNWVGGFDQSGTWTPIAMTVQTFAGRTTGTLAVGGQDARPLIEVRATGSHVHFKPVEAPGHLVFDGEVVSNTLIGDVQGDTWQAVFRLLRVVSCEPRLPEGLIGTYQLEPNRPVFVGNLLGSFRPTIYDFGTGAIRAIFPVAPDTWVAGPSLLVPAPIQTTLAFGDAGDGQVTSLNWQRQHGPRLCAPKIELRQEEASFANGEVLLAGTLLLPRGTGRHPAVVLIHGSGPQTRACVGLWAHWFARHGIAALSYDKRLAPAGATTGAALGSATFGNLAADALAGLHYLQSHPAINPRQVGLLGASQGGWVGPMGAAQSDDVAFLIIQAAPAVSVAQQNVQNLAYSLRADGFGEEEIRAAVAYMEQLNAFFRTGKDWEALAVAAEQTRDDAWFRYIGPVPDRPLAPRPPSSDLDRDPVRVLEQVGCPVLALYGVRDTVVPLVENRALLERGLRGGRCPDYTVAVFPGADHLMIDRDTGAGGAFPYATRFVTDYFATMRDWLHQRIDQVN